MLQENVILFGIRQDRWREVSTGARLAISCSLGVSDLDGAESRELPAGIALDLATVDKVLRLPVCGADDEALAVVDSWPTDLRGLGLDISTGPVVPFRGDRVRCQGRRGPGDPCTAGSG